MSRDRRAAEARGRRAEFWAALWLSLKGYRILVQRAKTPMGELDLVARKGEILAIIEVKARATLEAGLASISWHQQQRLVRGAASFVGRKPELSGLFIRYDLMIMRPWRLPHHERQFFIAEGRDVMDIN